MRTGCKRFTQLCSITILAFLVFTYSGTAQILKRFEFEEPKMGSPFQIILYSKDSISAKAYELVDSLNLIFSDYVAESELNQLSHKADKNKSV